MNAIFPLKPKSSIKAVNDKNTMMRLKMQNALIHQELNRVKAANAALALAAQKREQEAAQNHDHEARLALEARRQNHEHEARLALEARRQNHEHEARLALEARIKHQHQQQQHQQHQHHHQQQQQEAHVAPQIKKSKFGKLLSDMNKLKYKI